MPTTVTPLRYPGGKTQFYPLIKELLTKNGLIGHTYIEPFAGGAGIAIKLLVNNDVNRVIINDIDPAIYALWYSILHFPDDLCSLIEDTPVTVDEWHRQKEIYQNKKSKKLFLGFSTLFLNRTNVSGVIKGGIIGGLQQNGPYGINARYTKTTQIKKIKTIKEHKEKIDIFNLDALELFKLKEIKTLKKTFINFDPPYVSKGAGLYENSYTDDNHKKLAAMIKKCSRRWVVTYDVHPLISELYTGFRYDYLDLNYSINTKRKAKDYIFFSPNMYLSNNIKSHTMKRKRSILNGK
jgi:DNA adenine methylase